MLAYLAWESCAFIQNRNLSTILKLWKISVHGKEIPKKALLVDEWLYILHCLLEPGNKSRKETIDSCDPSNHPHLFDARLEDSYDKVI